MKTPSTITASALTLTLGLSASVAPASAHPNDPDPGPKELVEAFIGNGTAPDDEAGDDELVLRVEFDHDTHGAQQIRAVGVATGGTRNFPFGDPEVFPTADPGLFRATSSNGDPDRLHLRYQHEDCSPRNALIVRAEMREIDIGLETTLLDLAAVSLPGIGVGWWIANRFRSDEDYGSDLALVPPRGDIELSLEGVNGITTIPVTSRTTPVDGQCINAPEPAADPDRRTSEAFGALGDAYARLDRIGREPGTEAGATEDDVIAFRRATAAAILGTARLLAAREIGALSNPEIETAVAAYVSAEAHAAAGDVAAALDDFEVAFHVAAAIRAGGGTTELGNALPTGLLFQADQVVVPAGGSVELRAQIVGLGADEWITDVRASGGLPVTVVAGHRRLAVALAAELADHPASRVLGLGRFDGAIAAEPTETCAYDHLIAADRGRGVTVDGAGPFLETSACGYGRIVATRMQVAGGVAADASFFEGTLGVEVELDGVAPGDHAIEVTATIAGLDGEREVTTIVELRVVEAPVIDDASDELAAGSCGGCRSSGGSDGSGGALALMALVGLALRRRSGA